MAKSTALNVTQNLKNPCVTILPADATALKVLYIAGANDAVVKAINASSTDTAARNLALYINNGVADFLVGAVNIPITAGDTGAIASVDVLASALIPSLPLDQNGKRQLLLQAGYSLKVGVLVAVTAAKQIDVVAFAEEY
jgi:type IV secretory pathway VirB6-like protein